MHGDAALCVLAIILALVVGPGCGGDSGNDASEQAEGDPAGPTFNDDVDFLRAHGDVHILSRMDGARVALSAQYQGRVMTSAVAPEARSLGWINRDFIGAAESETSFDNYGGEDRFWLGPEAGQFGLYFPQGSPFEFSAWQVPSAFNTGVWDITSESDTSATFHRTMQLTNYGGTQFDAEVERTVRLLSPEEAETHLGNPIPEDVRWVGFETINRITNTGDSAWTKERGVPSIWILGQYEPFGTTFVAVPFDTSQAAGGSEIVNDAYFGPVPDDRLELRNGHVLFKCDGEYRSKIGLGPAHATDVLGSYNPRNRILTLVHYNKPEAATEYVNSMWEIQDRPFAGDVVNAYNDGPPEPGVSALGGFYELETSSPALELASGESYTHVHRTMHLVASSHETLSPISEQVLGVSIGVLAAGIE